MSLEGFEFLSVFEADDVVGCDGFIERDGGSLEAFGGEMGSGLQSRQGCIDFFYQSGKFILGDRVVGGVCGDDLGGHLDYGIIVFHFTLTFVLRVVLRACED